MCYVFLGSWTDFVKLEEREMEGGRERETEKERISFCNCCSTLRPKGVIEVLEDCSNILTNNTSFLKIQRYNKHLSGSEPRWILSMAHWATSIHLIDLHSQRNMSLKSDPLRHFVTLEKLLKCIYALVSTSYLLWGVVINNKNAVCNIPNRQSTES